MILKRLKNQFQFIAFAVLIGVSAPLHAQSGIVTIGEASASKTGNSSTSPIFPNTKFVRFQTVYTKAEIQAAGGAAGLITSLGWRVDVTTSFYLDYTIRMGHTTATTSSSHNPSPTVPVYSASSINFTAGYHMLPLSTAFNWNGNDNILIDICYSRTSANTGTNAGSVYSFGATSPALRYRNSTGTTTLCYTDTQYEGFNMKPVIRLVMPLAATTCNIPTNLAAGSISATGATISWNAPNPAPALGYETSFSTSATPPSSGTATTALSRTLAGLSSGTMYYFWVRSKCAASSFSAWSASQFVTNCIAPTITSTNSIPVCGSGTSTLSATASAGTVYWFDQATGNNLLATGSTFTTPILNSARSYYVTAGQPTGSNVNAAIGAGSLTSTSFAAHSTPFYVYGSQKTQYIIKASELTAAGLSAGAINSIALEVVSVGNPVLSSFSISAGNTTNDSATNTFITGLMSVYNNASQTVTTGVNTFNFSTPLNWNGTSNLVLQICWNNGNAATLVNTVKYDNVPFTAQTHLYNVSSSASVSCSAATGITTSNSRPKFIVNGNGLCINQTRTEIAVDISTGTEYFTDADGDGYGAGAPVLLCEPTVGFVTDNSDCDDSTATVYPGAQEILYNGIDENCDGSMDEGNQLTTQIRASHCGTTLQYIYTSIFANTHPQASSYRFEITKVATGQVQYIERTQPWFQLTSLANYEYGTAYSIAVELQHMGTWLGYYGAACTVTTPALASGNTTAAQCGLTLAHIYSSVNVPSTIGASGYRFRVTNMTDPAGPNTVQQIDRNVSWFNLTMLQSYDYGKTYHIEVAVKSGTAFGAFGLPCSITTPTASSVIRQCGTTYNNIYSPIHAGIVPNVSGYRIRVTNMSTESVQIIDPAQSWINFSQIADYAPNTQYQFEVAVKTTGDFGSYGPACIITSAPAAIVGNGIVASADFKVVASPNPYSDTFALEIAESTSAQVEVRVFDMIGKLLEVRSVQPGDIASQRLGSNFPSGVYNVIVTQGETVKTLKIVKR